MNAIKVTNAKLVIDGKEIEVMISPKEFKKLTFQKKTGYEQVPKEVSYYYVDNDGSVNEDKECSWCNNSWHYDAANYYSDKTVAENNARADKLMRNLRRFAVEHRKRKIDWRNEKQEKYAIQYYSGDYEELEVVETAEVMYPFSIYFDSEKTAELAIDKYRKELIWYFTEYKDSL